MSDQSITRTGKLLSSLSQLTIMSELSRQLATIMFSDIVGYSRMMNQNEQNAIRLRKEVERIVKYLAPQYDGEIIQFYGDGALIMFDSNVEAVQCAFLIQKTIHQIEGVHVRIGIHAGDIALESGQIYGESVNIASRIESFCIPGAVMFSGRVYEDLRNQPDIDCKDLGVFQLKNINRPMHLYALTHEDITVPNPHELHGKGERSQKSIAVLPFVNMSPDPENEYFSDGISEEILNALSKEDALRVTARTSSFAYKGENKDIRDIGHALNVEYVLEGSVRKAGNRVRITSQLIQAKQGYHLLSETYDRTLDDIFEVQDEIAIRIKNQLRKTLGLDLQPEAEHVEPTENIEAYQDYLKGMFYWNKYDPENVKKAISFMSSAIEKDPHFAEAHAFISFCYSFLGGTGQMPATIALPLATEHADKALGINPDLVEANCAKGLVHVFQDWDMIKAEEHFNKAKAINRQSDVFLYTYSLFLKATGRSVEAVEILEEAVVIDPVSFIANTYLAEAYANNKQFEEAFAQIEHIQELFPGNSYTNLLKAWFYVYQEKYDEALEVARERIPEQDPAFKEIVALRGLLWGLTGNEKRAKACKARLTELDKLKPDVDFGYLYFCTGYGLDERAYMKKRLLDVANTSKGGLIMAFHNPFWKKVLNEPWLVEETSILKSRIII